jgi:hypothetical protein
VGTEVRQIRLNYQVTLLLVDGAANDERASGLLQIESPFRLETKAGTWTITPSEKNSHAPVCQLHLGVVSAHMDENKTLLLGFSEGSTVTTGRDGRYGSWNITGTGVPQNPRHCPVATHSPDSGAARNGGLMECSGRHTARRSYPRSPRGEASVTGWDGTGNRCIRVQRPQVVEHPI